VRTLSGASTVLDVDDLSCEELGSVLGLAARSPAELGPMLAGRAVALVFELPTARTRSAAEVAVVQLGGHPVSIQAAEVGIDERERAEDVARTLACYHAVIGARVARHDTLVRMVAALEGAGARTALVNLLSDRAHPTQAIADVLTMRQVFGELGGRTLAFVGDANNVWRSLAAACAMVGMAVRIAAPDGYGPDEDDLARLARLGGEVEVTDDPRQAVSGADVVYTDVWASMGQEDERERRSQAFAGFTVDDELIEHAASHAVVMHCLPAHRGEEITGSVLDGPRSVVWRQARNRLDAMRGLLAFLATSGSLGEGGA
jgi:ornithine carbamoyltransferase